MKHNIPVIKDGGAELERQANRANRIAKRKRNNIFHIGMSILLTTVLIFTICIVNTPEVVNASKTQINDEYTYYGVDNFQDYSRAIRKETCYRAGKQILGDVTDEQVKHCATLLTLQIAFETGYMTSNMCVNDKNCIGLKGYRDDGTYGFLKFDTQYDGYMMYSEKFFTYHYKKTIHTLIWGYIQPNGSYRWGWSTTDQARYVNFIRTKYNAVYRSL